jgi:hypothetical protein
VIDVGIDTDLNCLVLKKQPIGNSLRDVGSVTLT